MSRFELPSISPIQGGEVNNLIQPQGRKASAMKIKELKKGDWFTKKEVEFPSESQVWVRGGYDRTEKKYECYCFGDVNRTTFINGSKEVYVGFSF